MAIKKKGNVDYLNNVTPASLSLNDADSSVSNEVDNAPGINVGKQESVNRTKKKSLENWGRPRKSLIEGVKEVSVTIQLPEEYEGTDWNFSSFYIFCSSQVILKKSDYGSKNSSSKS